jgi:hypothetical protein
MVSLYTPQVELQAFLAFSFPAWYNPTGKDKESG